jgi:hypothetical protein
MASAFEQRHERAQATSRKPCFEGTPFVERFDKALSTFQLSSALSAINTVPFYRAGLHHDFLTAEIKILGLSE